MCEELFFINVLGLWIEIDSLKKKISKPVETRYANVYNLLDNLIFGLTLKIQFAIAFMCSNESLILLHTPFPNE